MLQALTGLYNYTDQDSFATRAAGWLQSVALLAGRLWIAKVFFASGLTKIKSWDTTLMLFADEYEVPLLSPDLAAILATSAELTLPLLLIIGLMTPLTALGLFIISLVIEVFVYPGTTEHYYWLLILGVLITHGGGKLGLDYWLSKKLLHRRSLSGK